MNNRIGVGQMGWDKLQLHNYFKGVKFDEIEQQKFKPPFVFILLYN